MDKRLPLPLYWCLSHFLGLYGAAHPCVGALHQAPAGQGDVVLHLLAFPHVEGGPFHHADEPSRGLAPQRDVATVVLVLVLTKEY